MRRSLIYIDHYDSFSHNLIDWLLKADPFLEIEYYHYDDPGLLLATQYDSKPLVFSPGPLRPSLIPLSQGLMREKLGKVPILGVCLGFQLMADALGAQIVKAQDPHHGTTRTINLVHKNHWLFKGMDSLSFKAAVYNSLAVKFSELLSHESLEILAYCEKGDIAALSYGDYAVGLQFHPESFLTEASGIMAHNWLQRLTCFEP